MADFFNRMIQSSWYTHTIGMLLRSVWLTLAACVMISALMSSCLYCQNWWTYYDSIRVITENRQQEYARQFAELYVATGQPEMDRSRFESLARAIAGTMRGRVLVVRKEAGREVLIAERDWLLNGSRTTIESTHDLSKWNHALAGVTATFTESNRPPFFKTLGLAWVWSAPDFFASPSEWIKFRLYNRSVPLWAAFVVLLISLALALTSLGRAAKAIYDLELQQVRGC